MSAPDSLKEIYLDEMKDLWSANDQMTRAVKTLGDLSHDPKLKEMLTQSVDGIIKHTAALKSLIEETGGEVEPEHCKGMEGLVREALKHGKKEAPDADDLHDIAIIAQYQRMSHYGLAGFGSAAAYAKALGLKEHSTRLKEIVSDIYKADQYLSSLGEKTLKLAAKHDASKA